MKLVDTLACQKAFHNECLLEASVRKNVRVQVPPPPQIGAPITPMQPTTYLCLRRHGRYSAGFALGFARCPPPDHRPSSFAQRLTLRYRRVSGFGKAVAAARAPLSYA